MEQDTKSYTPHDEENVWNNKKIREQCRKLVKEYIDSEHKEERFIYSLTQIQDYLKTRTDIPEIPSSTFYRYMNNMGIKKFIHPLNDDKFHYDFDDSSDDANGSLDFCLNFHKYNKTLYVTVSPYLGDLLATFLNRNFSKKLFYSTHTQGLLVCHYFYKKNADKSTLGQNYLTSKYLKEEIKTIAKSIKYDED